MAGVFDDRGLDRLRRYFAACGLSQFGAACAIEFLAKHIAAEDGELKMRRVIQFLLQQLNGPSDPRDVPYSPYQVGCPNLMAGLRSSAFWELSLFPWIQTFHDSFEEIRGEILALQHQPALIFQVNPYYFLARQPS